MSVIDDETCAIVPAYQYVQINGKQEMFDENFKKAFFFTYFFVIIICNILCVFPFEKVKYAKKRFLCH